MDKLFASRKKLGIATDECKYQYEYEYKIHREATRAERAALVMYRANWMCGRVVVNMHEIISV